MFYPELEEVFKLKDKGNLIPLYIEFDAGSETPLSVYSKVASTPYSFLLESADGRDLGILFESIKIIHSDKP